MGKIEAGNWVSVADIKEVLQKQYDDGILDISVKDDILTLLLQRQEYLKGD
jgi:frataxin-like iron-binding protein CyaY